jgi:hypothetical protein
MTQKKKSRATKVNTETNTDPVISYDAANQTCTVSPRLVDASMQTNFPHMMPEDLKGDDTINHYTTIFIILKTFWEIAQNLLSRWPRHQMFSMIIQEVHPSVYNTRNSCFRYTKYIKQDFTLALYPLQCFGTIF